MRCWGSSRGIGRRRRRYWGTPPRSATRGLLWAIIVVITLSRSWERSSSTLSTWTRSRDVSPKLPTKTRVGNRTGILLITWIESGCTQPAGPARPTVPIILLRILASTFEEGPVKIKIEAECFGSLSTEAADDAAAQADSASCGIVQKLKQGIRSQAASNRSVGPGVGPLPAFIEREQMSIFML